MWSQPRWVSWLELSVIRGNNLWLNIHRSTAFTQRNDCKRDDCNVTFGIELIWPAITIAVRRHCRYPTKWRTPWCIVTYWERIAVSLLRHVDVIVIYRAMPVGRDQWINMRSLIFFLKPVSRNRSRWLIKWMYMWNIETLKLDFYISNINHYLQY